jgi:hypothetical protein
VHPCGRLIQRCCHWRHDPTWRGSNGHRSRRPTTMRCRRCEVDEQRPLPEAGRGDDSMQVKARTILWIS